MVDIVSPTGRSAFVSWLAGAALLAVLTGTATARAETSAGGDAAETRALMLVGACFNCHGSDGRLLSDAIPAIAGMPRSILQAQLTAFRAGQVPGTTVMDRIAADFSDDEIALMADWFAARAAPVDLPGDG
jgi:cytochrome subunit of sulfide dehydrogenase